MNLSTIINDETTTETREPFKSFKAHGIGKSLALWLIDNTDLTFEQIANFCCLHKLEVKAIADNEIGEFITPQDPIAMQLLDMDTIELCTKDPTKQLSLPSHNPLSAKLALSKNSARYLSTTKKKNKPDAIAWMLKNHPYMSDKQITSLISTTKTTIQAIRDKTYKGMKSLKPRSPVVLGLCTISQLNHAAMYGKIFYDRQQIQNDSLEDSGSIVIN